MSSPSKGGLKGGYQLVSPSSHFSQKNLFHSSPKKLFNSPSKKPSDSNSRITDYLKNHLKGNSAASSSDDHLESAISSDVLRVLEETIDFINASNPENILLTNVQKKGTNISSVKLVKFQDSSALPCQPLMNGSPHKENGSLQKESHDAHQQSGSKSPSGKSPVSSPSKANPDDLPSPKKTFFDENDIRLDWCRIQRTLGSGLSNVGNTCFLNATLQCLAHTPPLFNHLADGLGHAKQCEVRNAFCVLCALERTFRDMFSPNRPACIKPVALISNIKAFAKSLSIGRQEDAHEFLRFVVDAMRKSGLHGQNLKTLDVYSQETTFASRIFGGFYRSRVTCMSCKHPSNVYDPFMDIPLDVGKGIDNLGDALANFTRKETLNSPHNLYKCENCKKMSPATKQVTVHRPPNVLTFQLKRFLINGFGGYSKIDKRIDYPETLDLERYISPEARTGPVCYSLYGVLVHSGHSCHSGHYYAFVKSGNGVWHRMDDSWVQAVGKATPFQQSAYLLFYCRDAPPKKQSNVQHSPPSPVKRPAPEPTNQALKLLRPFGSSQPKTITPASTSSTSHSVNVGSNTVTIPKIGPVAPPAKQIQTKTPSTKPLAPFMPRAVFVKNSPKTGESKVSLVPYGSDDESEKSEPKTPPEIGKNVEVTAPASSTQCVPQSPQPSPEKKEPSASVPVAETLANSSASNPASSGVLPAMCFEDTSPEPPPATSSTPPVASEPTSGPTASMFTSAGFKPVETTHTNRSPDPTPVLGSSGDAAEPSDSAKTVGPTTVTPSIVPVVTTPTETPSEAGSGSSSSKKKKKKKKHKRHSHGDDNGSLKSDASSRTSAPISTEAGHPVSEEGKKKKKKKRRKHKKNIDSASGSSTDSTPKVQWVEKDPESGGTNGKEAKSSPPKVAASCNDTSTGSWDGSRSVLEVSEAKEREEKRKRKFEDELDDDYDRGREKKHKHHRRSHEHRHQNGNGFQKYQDYKNKDLSNGHRKH